LINKFVGQIVPTYICNIIMKDTEIKFRTESKLKEKLVKKAKRYKLSLSEIMRRKLNDDNDKHLFI